MRNRCSVRCSRAVGVLLARLALGVWGGRGGRLVKFRERGQAVRGPLDVAIRFFGVN